MPETGETYATLHTASFRNQEFFVAPSATSGGRKYAVTQFVNTDKVDHEDQGLLNPTYSVQGVIAARFDNNGTKLKTYEVMRDALVRALEKKGPGRLVHPFYGTINNVRAMTWSIQETPDSLGISTISMTFEHDKGRKVIVDTTLESQVAAANAAITTAVNDRMAADIAPSLEQPGVYEALIDKGTSAIDRLKKASLIVQGEVDRLEKFSTQISEMSAKIASLAATPTQLADAVSNRIAALKGLHQTLNTTPALIADAVFRTFESTVDFGIEDFIIPPGLSFAKLQEKKNRETFNAAIQVASLGEMYLASAQKEYTTDEEIADRTTQLEKHFQRIYSDATIPNEMLDPLERTRQQTHEVLDQKLADVRRVTTISTPPISAAVLAYQYYGSSELGTTLAELNSAETSHNLFGAVRVLTG
jgi:prophage DNA circulation protein